MRRPTSAAAPLTPAALTRAAMTPAALTRAALTSAGMALALVLTGTPANAAIVVGATASTDLKIVGGDAAAAIVCGNVAAADDLAQQRHIVVQHSKCTAKAVGGSVVMENVDIYLSAASLALNRDNAVLSAIGVTAAPGVATDNCDGHRPSPAPGTQLNKCWAISHGGRLTLDNVTAVSQRSDGVVTTRTVTTAVTVATSSSGSADAQCRNVATDPVNQQDDCLGSGVGASWSMKKVDVVVHNADGTSTTRRGVNVEVRGGNADAYVYCFNVTDGSGHVVQVNVCSATADGGDATLRNVTVHASS